MSSSRGSIKLASIIITLGLMTLSKVESLIPGQNITLYTGDPTTLDALDSSWFFNVTTGSYPAAALYPRAPASNAPVRYSTYHQFVSSMAGSAREAVLAARPTTYLQWVNPVALGLKDDVAVAQALCNTAPYNAQSFTYSYEVQAVSADYTTCEYLGGDGTTSSGARLYCFYHQTGHHKPLLTSVPPGGGVQFPNLSGNNSAIMLLYKSQVRESDVTPAQDRGSRNYFVYASDIRYLPKFNQSTVPPVGLVQYEANSGTSGATTTHRCTIDTGFWGDVLALVEETSAGSLTRDLYYTRAGDVPVPLPGAGGVGQQAFAAQEGTGSWITTMIGEDYSVLLISEDDPTPCALEVGDTCLDALYIAPQPPGALPSCGQALPGNYTVSIYGNVSYSATLYECTTAQGSQYFVKADWTMDVPVGANVTQYLGNYTFSGYSLTSSQIVIAEEPEILIYCEEFGQVSTSCPDNYSQYVYVPIDLCLKVNDGVNSSVGVGAIGLGSCTSRALVDQTLVESAGTTTVDGVSGLYSFWTFGGVMVGYQVCTGTNRVVSPGDPCPGPLQTPADHAAYANWSHYNYSAVAPLLTTRSYQCGSQGTTQLVAQYAWGHGVAHILWTYPFGAEFLSRCNTPVPVPSLDGDGTQMPVTSTSGDDTLGAIASAGELLASLTSLSANIALGVDALGLEVVQGFQGIEAMYALQAQQEAVVTGELTIEVDSLKARMTNIEVSSRINSLALQLLGGNGTLVSLPGGQGILNGSFADCVAGNPGESTGGNVTWAYCHVTGKVYDVAYDPSCVPYGAPFTGTTPAGSTPEGECLYDNNVLLSRLLNNEAAAYESQQAIANLQVVVTSINSMLATFSNTTNGDLSDIHTQLASFVNALSNAYAAAAAAQNGTSKASAKLGSLGDILSGDWGLGSTWGMILHVLEWALLAYVIFYLFRSLRNQVLESVARRELANAMIGMRSDFVTRDEFERAVGREPKTR